MVRKVNAIDWNKQNFEKMIENVNKKITDISNFFFLFESLIDQQQYIYNTRIAEA